MDKLKAFLEAMTLWNWLALIAFIFLPLSALNAFFGLRSRYKDWRGTKSKKAFEKRLKQLSEELKIVETFKNNIQGYFVYVLDAAVTPLRSFGLAFMLLLFAFLLPDDIPKMPIVFIALMATINGAGSASHLFRVIRFMAVPVTLAMEIIDFVKNAYDKRLEAENAKALITLLTNSGMFTQTEKNTVSSYLFKHFPEMSASIAPALVAQRKE